MTIKKYYLNGQTTENYALSLEQIQNNGLLASDYVWFEGLSEWTLVEQIDELKPFIKKTIVPPPFQTKPNTQNPNQAKTESVTPHRIPPSVSNSPLLRKHFGYTIAGRGYRLFASIIESIILLVPIFLILGKDIYNEDAWSFSSFLGYGVFHAMTGAIFYPMWSGNLGHKILGLKVISLEDGREMNTAKDGAIREVLKHILSYLLLPIIWLLWDGYRQNLYDKIINTIVVKK